MIKFRLQLEPLQRLRKPLNAALALHRIQGNTKEFMGDRRRKAEHAPMGALGNSAWSLGAQSAVLLFFAYSCAWMGGIVNLRQVLIIQMGVDLRRADIGMTEQFLHGAQIAARF